MKEIILDGNMLAYEKQAHIYLKEKLKFPDYYGGNLDSLADCLTDLDQEKIMIIPSDTETDFLKRILLVFKAAEKTGDIIVEFL